MLLQEQRRSDGRRPEEIRPINSSVSLLPMAHGSAIFTRGETQAICTSTLAGESYELREDAASGCEFIYLYISFVFITVIETNNDNVCCCEFVSSLFSPIKNTYREIRKRFYLMYTFPPYSVGECGRFGAPGRREIGLLWFDSPLCFFFLSFFFKKGLYKRR